MIEQASHDGLHRACWVSWRARLGAEILVVLVRAIVVDRIFELWPILRVKMLEL